MLGIHLRFREIPRIGFAHHFHMTDYCQIYGRQDNSFEIVYTKTGGITAELYGKRYEVQPGSVLVLMRNLPIKLYSADGIPQSHCTVQLMTEHTFELIENDSRECIGLEGLVLPFITPPCPENEMIKKELYSVISAVAGGENKDSLSPSLRVLGTLSRMDTMYRQKIYSQKNTPSLLTYKIKRYVAENMDKEISLSEISQAIGRTPNYLNSVFREGVGMSIHQYISREKVHKIGELMENKGMPFKTACANVAISDVSYGYRLFKKHTGVTPKAFLAGERLQR